MGLFRSEKKMSVSRAARKLVVWIQAGVVEQVCQAAEQEKKSVHNAGLSALLNALAIVFWCIDQAVVDSQMTDDQAVRLKSAVAEFFVRAGYKTDKVTQEMLSSFLNPVYDLRKALADRAEADRNGGMETFAAESICGLSELSDRQEGEIAGSIRELIDKTRQLLKKYQIES